MAEAQHEVQFAEVTPITAMFPEFFKLILMVKI